MNRMCFFCPGFWKSGATTEFLFAPGKKIRGKKKSMMNCLPRFREEDFPVNIEKS